jgi:C1A family cysteine protease
MTKADSEGKIASDVSDKTLNDYGKAWTNVNHSVMLVGWGEDDVSKEKYWVARNSYGKSWGVDGDFMIKRGNDDMGSESEQVAFEMERL